jgi:phosphoribosylaminoimidazole-succinocarboxamide synthase
MSSEAIVSIDIEGKLPKVASGKVRDLFAIDDETLLFVASDRISAYDVVMENVSLWKSHTPEKTAPRPLETPRQDTRNMLKKKTNKNPRVSQEKAPSSQP